MTKAERQWLKWHAANRLPAFLQDKLAEEALELSLAHSHINTKGSKYKAEFLTELGHLKFAILCFEKKLTAKEKLDVEISFGKKLDQVIDRTLRDKETALTLFPDTKKEDLTPEQISEGYWYDQNRGLPE